MGDSPKHVLIVLMGAIGDVVRGLSVATTIKAAWPETRISWAVEPISKSLVQAHPAIDRIVVFERSRKLQGYRDFIRELRCEEYDICLDLQRHFKSGLTAWLSKAPRRIGFDKANSREGNWLFQTEHIADQVRDSPKINQFLAFCERLEIAHSQSVEFGLSASVEEQERVAGLLKDISPDARARVAFLIGSTWNSRQWSEESYAHLADLLWERQRIAAVIVGGPGDQPAAKRISSACRIAPIVDLSGETSLRELAAVFAEMQCAIGSDSGPMHIAAACGTPIVSLWGATSSIRSGPYGWENYCLQSALGCVPCYRKNCPGLGRLCMSSISPEIVHAQLNRLFDVEGVLK